MKISKLLAAAACGAMVSSPVLAETASNLTFINGESADAAERSLRSRGFDYVTSNTNSMGYTYSYWWDHDDKNCVRIEAYDGSVMTVADATKSDCNHSGDNDAAVAVGVVAGAAILGAILAHKSNHHDDSKHYSNSADESAYERGYRDGLYNGAYHNSERSSVYSSGYSAGVSERNANLRTHTGHGGYSSAATFKDLEGDRAAGASDELTRRGFAQVDNFTSGDTRYSIRWRASSRQCIQETIADGRAVSIDDIQTHPNCR